MAIKRRKLNAKSQPIIIFGRFVDRNPLWHHIAADVVSPPETWIYIYIYILQIYLFWFDETEVTFLSSVLLQCIWWSFPEKKSSTFHHTTKRKYSASPTQYICFSAPLLLRIRTTLLNTLLKTHPARVRPYHFASSKVRWCSASMGKESRLLFSVWLTHRLTNDMQWRLSQSVSAIASEAQWWSQVFGGGPPGWHQTRTKHHNRPYINDIYIRLRFGGDHGPAKSHHLFGASHLE